MALKDKQEHIIKVMAETMADDFRRDELKATGKYCASPYCMNLRPKEYPWCDSCLEFFGETYEKPKQLYVYFIQNRDSKNIKIGVSRSPKLRIKSLETGCDAELLILAVVECWDTPDLERRIHAAYKEHRKIREWFYPTDDILDLVELAQDGKPGDVIKRVRRRYVDSPDAPGASGKEVKKSGRQIAYVMT